MPKIPDETALGGRPAMNVTALPSAQPAGAGVSQAANIYSKSAGLEGQGIASLGDSLIKTGNAIAKGEARIRSKQETIARFRDIDAFNTAAVTEFDRLGSEEDWSDPKTVGAYRAFLDGKRAEILDNHGGGDESRMALNARLTGITTSYAMKAAGVGADAQDKLMASVMGETLNQINTDIMQNPGKLVDSFRSWDAAVADAAGSLPPDQERYWRNRGRAAFTKTAIGTLLGMPGGAEEANRILDLPGISAVLDPKDVDDIRQDITKATGVIEEARRAGIAKRMEAAAALGIDPNDLTQQDVLQYLDRAPSARADNQTVEIQHPSDPNATIIVPRSLVGDPRLTDPEFLKQYPRGKPPTGMVLRSDGKGGFELVQGRGAGTTDDKALTTGSRGQLEKGEFDARASLSRLREVDTAYRPEFQEIGTRGQAWWAGLKSKAGQDLSADETKLLNDISVYKRRSFESLNAELNRLSGAAISPDEAKRLIKGMPNPGTGLFDGDNPVEFKAKLDDTIRATRMAIARYHWARKEGLNPLETGKSYNDMPKIMRQRLDEMAKEYKAENPNANEDEMNGYLRGRLAAEFGLD